MAHPCTITPCPIVTPSPTVVGWSGTVWITDFGLAKTDDQQNITHTGDILGTLRYMPPEAFEGKSDHRGDIYSLGLTLYEMLAMQQQGIQVEVYPLLREREEVVHPEAMQFVNVAHFQPFLSLPILRANLFFLGKKPFAGYTRTTPWAKR